MGYTNPNNATHGLFEYTIGGGVTATCGYCGEKHSPKRVPLSQAHAVSILRHEGWTIGKKILCKTHRNYARGDWPEHL